MDDELIRYRTEQAEAWLSKVRKTVSYANQLKESANAVRERADNLRGLDYSRDNVSGTATADAIPDAIILSDELADTLESIEADARERVKQAALSLSKMDDLTEATCLTLYFVEACETWEQVCAKMGYTHSGMMKLRRRALLNAYEVMPHAERDPMYMAI